MSIAVTCRSCQTLLQLGDEWGGKQGKCPNCQAVVDVPAAQSWSFVAPLSPAPAAPRPAPPRTVAPGAVALVGAAPAAVQAMVAPAPIPKAPREAAERSAFGPVPADPQALSNRVLSGFARAIDPIDVPASYHWSVLASAVVLLLLVAIYLGLIGAIGWSIWYHAASLFAKTGVMRSGLDVGLSLLIVVVGPVVLLFLIKPLFHWETDSSETRTLDPQKEPLLFAFVERVCTAVGAPVPSVIKVDADINASAGFRNGMWSIFGNDLVLTIGLPLAAGLNLRQFAGVLAHEFGHFTQGTGMRLTYLVRSLSMWFARVVYDRDWLDEWLEEMGRARNRLVVIVWVVQFFVGAARGVLWLLLMAGQLAVGYLLREMEYDADRHETRLAGSDTFESTCRKMALLGFACRGAKADLQEFAREGRLGDDLPLLIVDNVKHVPKKVREALDEVIDESTTELFDTHPSDRERIAASRMENAPGVFRLDWPASVVFANFPQLCREVTWDYYQSVFGSDLSPSEIHPLSQLLAARDQRQEDFRAAERYFQGAISLYRPLYFSNFRISAPLRIDTARTQLGALRARVLGEKEAYIKLLDQYMEVDQLDQATAEAAALVFAGARAPFPDNPVAPRNPHEAQQAQAHVLHRKQELSLQMTDFEKAACARLAAALQFLEVPSVLALLPDGAGLRAEAMRLYRTLTIVAAQIPSLMALRNDNIALNACCSYLMEMEQGAPEVIRMIQLQLESCHQGIKQLYERLEADPYPFDHAKGSINLAEYAVQGIPPVDDIDGLIYVSNGSVETLLTLFARCLGRLTSIGEQIELALGMPRLPEMVHSEDE